MQPMDSMSSAGTDLEAGLPRRLSGPAVPLCPFPREPPLSLNLLGHPDPLYPIATLPLTPPQPLDSALPPSSISSKN